MAAPIIQRREALWFADDYKGSTIKPNVGVIHTTEGYNMPGYNGGATAPNYTAEPDFTKKRLVWVQHYPDTMSSRALKNLSGGVETNTLNALQVELIGTCDPATAKKWKAAGKQFIYWPDAPQWALDEVAEFVALKNKQLGIPIEGPEQIKKTWVSYPASYGLAPQRFSFAQWRAFTGWCGHQHVPENVHGDPGDIDWAYIETKAKSLVAGKPVPPTTPTKETTMATLDEVLAAVQALDVKESNRYAVYTGRYEEVVNRLTRLEAAQGIVVGELSDGGDTDRQLDRIEDDTDDGVVA